jgi:hypothetical protein
MEDHRSGTRLMRTAGLFLSGLLLLTSCEQVKVARLEWIEPLPRDMEVAYSHQRAESGNSIRQRGMDVVVQSHSDPDMKSMERRFFNHLRSNEWRLFGDPPNAAAKYDDEGGCVTSFPLADQEQLPERVQDLPGQLLFVSLSFC